MLEIYSFVVGSCGPANLSLRRTRIARKARRVLKTLKMRKMLWLWIARVEEELTCMSVKSTTPITMMKKSADTGMPGCHGLLPRPRAQAHSPPSTNTPASVASGQFRGSRYTHTPRPHLYPPRLFQGSKKYARPRAMILSIASTM